MISISISNDQINRAFADLSKYSATVQKELKKESVRAAFAIDSKAKNLVRVDKGQLRQSIHVEQKVGELKVSIPENGAVVGTNKIYATCIENGTQAHVIKPRNKKMLRWWNKGKGMFLFAKEVRHPGTKPYPFMRPAAESEQPIFIQNVLNILKNATK